MSGFIKGEDRSQATLFPERLDDYVAEDNPVRVIDVFLDDLDLSGLGFKSKKVRTPMSVHAKIGGCPDFCGCPDFSLLTFPKALSVVV